MWTRSRNKVCGLVADIRWNCICTERYSSTPSTINHARNVMVYYPPLVGFNYCLQGDDICSLSLAGCKGIRKEKKKGGKKKNKTNKKPPPPPTKKNHTASALHLMHSLVFTGSQQKRSSKVKLYLEIQWHSRDKWLDFATAEWLYIIRVDHCIIG